MLGERIKEERERLGWSIPEFAAVAGAGKNTVIDWQNGKSSPKASQLADLARSGVDVLYILTGNREPMAPALSPREAALLDNYRSSPEAAKTALEQTSAAFAQPGQLNTAPTGATRRKR